MPETAAETARAEPAAMRTQRAWLVPLAGSVLLALALRPMSPLLFHTVVELFSVGVGMLAGVVAWRSYPYSQNDFLRYLAGGLFWVAVIDLAHTLSYPGLGLIAHESAGASLQLWLAARFTQSLLFLTAPLFLRRSTAGNWMFALLGLVAVALLGAVLAGVMPAVLDTNGEATPIKVYAEVLFSGLLGVAAFLLWQRRSALDHELFQLLIWALAFSIGSELLLATSGHVGSAHAFTGHLLKLLSAWCVFLALVNTVLEEPLRILLRGASSYDAVPDPTVTTDLHGVVRQANAAACSRLGLASGDEVAGRDLHTLFHPAGIPRSRCPVCRALGRGEPLGPTELHFPERNRWEQITLAPILFGRRVAGMVHVAHDTTSRHDAEERLRRNEERLKAAQRVAGLGSWELDFSSGEIYWSDQMYRLLGLPAEDGPSVPAMIERIHPDDRERMEESIRRNAEATQLFFRNDFRLLLADGEVRHLHSEGRGERDDTGHVRRLVGTLQDVTERLRIEQELRRYRYDLERLVEARTGELNAVNRELETFSYSVSHDLRGPLRAINGFSQALVEDCGEQLDATARDYLDRIAKASRHMSELIDGILVLSRVIRRELSVTEVDLSELADDIARRLHASEPERRVRIAVEPGLTVHADANMMRLLLENLLGNAWKFTSTRAEAEISMERAEHDGRSCFCVRDNGVGFDMRFVAKLFQPFQRLHGPSRFEGTGIGLATVRRIIQRHGGEVWAEGEVDRFAAIYFRLGDPAAAQRETGTETVKQ